MTDNIYALGLISQYLKVLKQALNFSVLIFTEIIPEALETTCGKCSPKQKQLIRTVIKAVIAKHPEAWEQLSDKYDKDKKYKDSFDKFLAEQE